MANSKNNIFAFQTPQTLLAIIKQIPDSADDLASLLLPINKSLVIVRDKINKGEGLHIPYLQKLIDEGPKDVNFQVEYDKFIAELKPSDVQCRALSMSLIMVVSLEIKSVAMIASEIFQNHDPKSGWTLQRIREMSNNCIETNWADGVYAASNYVRHSEEWRLLPITKTKDGKPLKMDAFERLKEELPHDCRISPSLTPQISFI